MKEDGVLVREGRWQRVTVSLGNGIMGGMPSHTRDAVADAKGPHVRRDRAHDTDRTVARILRKGTDGIGQGAQEGALRTSTDEGDSSLDEYFARAELWYRHR